MESTWHTPCGQLFPEECKQIQVQKTIEETYNCRIPMFMTGNHIVQNTSLPECSEGIVLKAFTTNNESSEECPNFVPCHSSKVNLCYQMPTKYELAVKLNGSFVV